jgi:tetratricopeptide (TPR) repeat protein
MRRLLKYTNAYQHQAEAAEMLEAENLDDEKVKEANEAFAKAVALMPPDINPELVFWHAVSLVEAKRVDEALPLFKQVFEIDSNWRDLVLRLVPSEVLPDDVEIIDKIVGV